MTDAAPDLGPLPDVISPFEPVTAIDPTMAETVRPPHVEIIFQYLGVLGTNDLDNLRLVDNSLSTVLYPPGAEVTEDYTATVIEALEALQTQTSPEAAQIFNEAREAAALHIIRGMIDGLEIPIQDFRAITRKVIAFLAYLGQDKSQSRAAALVVKEIESFMKNDIMADQSELGAIRARRCAEAYGYFGKAKTYGAWMVQVNNKERRSGVKTTPPKPTA